MPTERFPFADFIFMARPKTTRDVQKTKLYRAERAAGLRDEADPDLAELPAATAYVRRVTGTAWFRARFHTYDVVRVHDGRGRSHAGGGYGAVWLPRWSRSRWVILHELAHVIAMKRDGQWHGPLFAAVYLELVRHYLGREAADRLRDAFKAKGVRYRPRRVLTAEQRAALRDRLAAARVKYTSARPTTATAYRCDKCAHEWAGDAGGRCPACGVGVDVGNVVGSVPVVTVHAFTPPRAGCVHAWQPHPLAAHRAAGWSYCRHCDGDRLPLPTDTRADVARAIANLA